jgi:hypothetical protein
MALIASESLFLITQSFIGFYADGLIPVVRQRNGGARE